MLTKGCEEFLRLKIHLNICKLFRTLSEKTFLQTCTSQAKPTESMNINAQPQCIDNQTIRICKCLPESYWLKNLNLSNFLFPFSFDWPNICYLSSKLLNGLCRCFLLCRWITLIGNTKPEFTKKEYLAILFNSICYFKVPLSSRWNLNCRFNKEIWQAIWQAIFGFRFTFLRFY